MEHSDKDKIKPIIHHEIIRTVEEMHLSKEKTAEILGIEARSVAYLKSGTTMCSATTFIMYLIRLCPDPVEFINKIKEFLDKKP